MFMAKPATTVVKARPLKKLNHGKLAQPTISLHLATVTSSRLGLDSICSAQQQTANQKDDGKLEEKLDDEVEVVHRRKAKLAGRGE